MQLLLRVTYPHLLIYVWLFSVNHKFSYPSQLLLDIVIVLLHSLSYLKDYDTSCKTSKEIMSSAWVIIGGLAGYPPGGVEVLIDRLLAEEGFPQG